MNVGMLLGVDEGLALGIVVELDEGCCVGAAVVGCCVGATVGAAVVGATVGRAVGAEVAPGTLTLTQLPSSTFVPP